MKSTLMKLFMKAHVAVYEMSGGKVGGSMGGNDVLLLTTTGRTSGQPRKAPLMRIEHEGQLHVIASAAGADRHPAWFRNLEANPSVTVQDGADTFGTTAVVLEGEERDAVYAAAEAAMDNFTDYKQKADRVIPVVRLPR